MSEEKKDHVVIKLRGPSGWKPVLEFRERDDETGKFIEFRYTNPSTGLPDNTICVGADGTFVFTFKVEGQ